MKLKRDNRKHLIVYTESILWWITFCETVKNAISMTEWIFIEAYIYFYLFSYHRKERKNIIKMPRNMQPSCLNDSLGFVSLRSSGNTETKAAIRVQLVISPSLSDFGSSIINAWMHCSIYNQFYNLYLFTYIQEAGSENSEPSSLCCGVFAVIIIPYTCDCDHQPAPTVTLYPILWPHSWLQSDSSSLLLSSSSLVTQW